MKNKVVLICPYFGKLPNYFGLFLKSCEFNKEFNWLIFTDDSTERYGLIPDNVKIINTKFDQLKLHIQSCFDFDISLDNPYKLCDFKPCYGIIFEKYLKEYDFWGHCDIDCIYGNLAKFITDEILDNYDKIFFLGHLTLYRNNEQINNLFKLGIKSSDLTYKEILSSNRSYAFDESLSSLSLNTISKEYQLPRFEKQIFADICCLYQDFRLYNYDESLNYTLEKRTNQIFKWQNGKLISIRNDSNGIKEKEYGYIHLQKREMKVDFNLDSDGYLIVPNSFVPLIDNEDALTLYKTNKLFSKKLIELKIINRIKGWGKKYVK